MYIDYYFIFNVTILLGNTMKILIAIGGREYSKPTLDLGMKIANSFKSSTTIAYVGKKISQFSEKDVSVVHQNLDERELYRPCLLYTSPSPRDKRQSRMPSSA